MFTKINKKDTEYLLLHQAGFSATDNYWEVGLSEYPSCYRVHHALQLDIPEDGQELMEQLTESALPEIPEGWKVTAVLEMAAGLPMERLDDIYTWVTGAIEEAKLERIVPVFLYEGTSRLTLVYHEAERRHSYCSRIKSQARRLHDMDLRIAAKLDEELSRNDEVETVISLDIDLVRSMLHRSHLLWTDVASTVRSTDEIVKRFRPEINRTKLEFDLSGLFLFFEVDRKFTTMGEVNNLKKRIAKMAGVDDMAVNVRVKESFIKSITCRLVLLGSPKLLNKDEVFEDFGQYEILLYESEDQDQEHGYIIIASVCQDKLTVSRYDWGDFERNRRGQTDDHHYFDEENTAKLFAALRVKKPSALLRTIRRRFASRLPSCADTRLLAFCRKEGIKYQSEYYY